VCTHLCLVLERTDLQKVVPSALGFISVDQMSLQIKIPYDFYTHDRTRLFPIVLAVLLVLFGDGYLTARARDCKCPRSLALNPNSTTPTFFALCNISFDECLCPLPSHLSTHGVKCMSSVLIKAIHVVPLFSYVLQVCAIHAYFSLDGIYSNVLRRTLWLVALLIFMFVAIGAQDSRCLYDYTSIVLIVTSGVVIVGFFCSYDAARKRHIADTLRETHQIQQSAA
jgi:hypothetical protein